MKRIRGLFVVAAIVGGAGALVACSAGTTSAGRSGSNPVASAATTVEPRPTVTSDTPGWGPGRETFTTAIPADFITFNSIIDNPAHGDERNFMHVKSRTAGNATYRDSIALAAGRDYMIYMYFHNNAATNLNLAAIGTYAKAQIPAVVPKGSKGTAAVGFIGASNAHPSEVWDAISFTNDTGKDVALSYVPGSATLHTFGLADEATLSDAIVASGTLLGYDSLDGSIPGCAQHSGYLTFLVRAS